MVCFKGKHLKDMFNKYFQKNEKGSLLFTTHQWYTTCIFFSFFLMKNIYLYLKIMASIWYGRISTLHLEPGAAIASFILKSGLCYVYAPNLRPWPHMPIINFLQENLDYLLNYWGLVDLHPFLYLWFQLSIIIQRPHLGFCLEGLAF